MIIIDGTKSDLNISNYANLEELLIHLSNHNTMQSRIITDVVVNNEPFSELYPHQAEDIVTNSISTLELKTISVNKMSRDILQELPKVIQMIDAGATNTAKLLRSGQTTEGLELMQDTIDVCRDLLQTLGLFVSCYYSQEASGQLQDFTKILSTLINEIMETMSDEDWILTADLFEYEVVPTTNKLAALIHNLQVATNADNIQ